MAVSARLSASASSPAWPGLHGRCHALDGVRGLGHRGPGALRAVRGNQRVTTQDPESTYESLEKFSVDLTKAAEDEKRAVYFHLYYFEKEEAIDKQLTKMLLREHGFDLLSKLAASSTIFGSGTGLPLARSIHTITTCPSAYAVELSSTMRWPSSK